MAWKDIEGAIRFFAGFSSGFSHQLEQERKTHEQQQLQLLTLLQKDDTNKIEPVQPGDVVPPNRTDQFFGQGTYATKEGTPVYKVGSNYFASRKVPTYSAEQLMQRLGGGATATPTPEAPLIQTSMPVAPGTPSPVFGGSGISTTVAGVPATFTPPAGQPQAPTSAVAPGFRQLPALTGKQLGVLPGKTGFPGRPIMETENGGFSTHRTVTVQVGDQWYQIPAMFGGKEVSQDEARRIMMQHQMVDPETGDRYQGYPTPDAADKAAEPLHDTIAARAKNIIGSEPPTASAGQPSESSPIYIAPGSVSIGGKPVVNPQVLTPSPPVVSLPPLPPGETKQQFLLDFIKKNTPIAGIPANTKGEKEFLALRKEADLEYGRQKTQVLAEKTRLLPDEQHPQLRPMLLQVQTPTQLDHYLAVKAQVEASDPTDYKAKKTLATEAESQRQRKNIEQEYAPQARQDALTQEENKQRVTQRIHAEGMPQRLTEAEGMADIRGKEAVKDAKLKKQDALELQQKAHEETLVPPAKLEAYAHAKTLMPVYHALTWKELDEGVKNGEFIPLSRDARHLVVTTGAIRGIAQDILEMTAHVFGPDGSLKGVTQDQGFIGRLKGTYAKRIADAKQNDPILRKLDERLKEWGVAATKTTEGLGARPGKWAVEGALSVRPTLGGDGRLPDTKETIEAQVGGVLRLMNLILTESIGRSPEPSARTLKPSDAAAAPTLATPPSPLGDPTAGFSDATRKLLDLRKQQPTGATP